MMNTNFSLRSYQPMMAKQLHFSGQSATAIAPTNPSLKLLLFLNPKNDQAIEEQLQRVANNPNISDEELLPVLKELWKKTEGSYLRAEITGVLAKKKLVL